MKYEITLKKSIIGCPKDQIGTVRALGLKKTGSKVVKEANDCIKGQIFKVKHLLEVKEI
ncbi:MAG: 50S ribosomal protein L30 [Clostridia bacterium]|jgi:large subunit ribosomal protein L30|nr:50S ribosomal protein L30 [Clostridia bacterium]MBQ5956793.1 50S ribosomal protein L30 [Clostridia bacterium]MBQ6004152.1 50S ribosomal protein L30 [Clostridia bacterium]MBR0437760.1 50S ribosomal protein L30 [Clostridia bacterium]MBR3564520.1 50S ribosomal protein L30 [Clostridia bacterium]